MLRHDPTRPLTPTLRSARQALQVAAAIPRSIDPYWRDLLGRLGVPTVDYAEGHQPAVAIGLGLDPDQDPRGLQELTDLWRAGAVVVASAEVAARLVGRHSVKVRGDRLIGDGFPFEGIGSVAVEGPVIALSATEVPAAVECVAIRPAPLFSISLPTSERLRGRRESLRTMTRIGDEPIRRRVSSTDHGRLRRLVQNVLREAFAVRGLPLVQKAWSPSGTQGALALHLTVDDPSSGRRALHALQTARLRASVRLRGRAEGMREEFVLSGHEVLGEPGAEGFGVGTRPAVDALPGLWPERRELRSATAEPTWEIPPHAVSPRDLLRHGAEPERVHDHVREVLRHGICRDEPTLFDLDARLDLDPVPGLLASLRQELDLFARSCETLVWQPVVGELHLFFRKRQAQVVQLESDLRRLRGEACGPIPVRVLGDTKRTVVTGTLTLDEFCSQPRAPRSVGSSALDLSTETGRPPRFANWRSRTQTNERVLKLWSRGPNRAPSRSTGTR